MSASTLAQSQRATHDYTGQEQGFKLAQLGEKISELATMGPHARRQQHGTDYRTG